MNSFNRRPLSLSAQLAVLLMMLVTQSGCGGMGSRHPVPENLVDRAEIPGMRNIRTWGDEQQNPEFIADMVKSREQSLAYFKAHPEERHPTHTDILAISGGGENGAFGAGLLCGWTQRGDRPQFRMVTGISTGALSAPFAFVGSSCDQKLKDAYTTISAHNVFTAKSMWSILGGDSLTDSAPLEELVAKWVDEGVLREVAREHAKGRRLMIGTTNLDAQRLVVWNMGAIASSGKPGALELFRKVMLASASIPGVFPPVFLDVEADGKQFDEMHVDGGALTQVFLWGASVDVVRAGRELGIAGPIAPVRIFVLRNAILRPDWKAVEPRLKSIVPRTFTTLFKSQGLGDMFRLYEISQREGFDFNVAYIPDDFTMELKEPFDRAYMNALFDLGFKMGREGYHWTKVPYNLGSVGPSSASGPSPATGPSK